MDVRDCNRIPIQPRDCNRIVVEFSLLQCNLTIGGVAAVMLPNVSKAYLGARVKLKGTRCAQVKIQT